MSLVLGISSLIASGCASFDSSDSAVDFTSAPVEGLILVASADAHSPGVTNLQVQLWAKADRQSEWHFRQYSRLTLVLSSGVVSTAPEVRGLRLPSRFPDRECHLTLRCLDMNADGTDEIIMTEAYNGCGWDPGRHALFAITNGQVLAVAELPTEELGCSKEIMLPDGRVAIPCTYAIGDMAHYAQPRWSDYYTYDGVKLRLVNSKLPNAFREWPRVLSKELAVHPQDGELWYFLGRAHLVMGNSDEALACFRKADEQGYSAHSSDARAGNWR